MLFYMEQKQIILTKKRSLNFTKCPNCEAKFTKVKYDVIEGDIWQKNKDYYSKKIRYMHNHLYDDKTSKTTVKIDMQRYHKLFICSKCQYGQNGEWRKSFSKQISKLPEPEIIDKSDEESPRTKFLKNVQSMMIAIAVVCKNIITALADQNPNKTNRRFKKQTPINIKIKTWKSHIGNKNEATCFIPKCKNKVSLFRKGGWECGHVKARSKGGTNDISNLRIICRSCNLDMGNENMNSYIERLKKYK